MTGDAVRITKGDLFWVELGRVISSAPAKRRPVVVIQGDHFNRSRVATTLVAAISSNTALADHPGNVFLPAATSDLPKDSVVNVTAVVALDKTVLATPVGTLPAYLIQEIDAGLRTVLDL